MSQPPRPPEPRYDPAYPPQPTGPMEGTAPRVPPLPTPESARVGPRPSQRRAAARADVTALVLGGLGLLVLQLGLALSPGTAVSLWSTTAAWSVFATLAALVALLALVPQARSRTGLDRRQTWQVGAAGAVGLVLFWGLVVVGPDAGTDRGFVLTLATGLVAGGIWLSRET